MRHDRPPPQRGRRSRRLVFVTPIAVATGVIFVSTVVLSAGGGRSDPLPAPAPAPASPPPQETTGPIWVPTPRRIDRAEQERQRVRIPAIATDSDAGLVTGRAGLPDLDGIFVVGGTRVRLEGLLLPDRGKVCVATSGARWACGLRAHGLLGVLVSGQQVACRPTDPLAVTEPIRGMSDCRARGRSVAERLVGEGWVDVEAERIAPALVALHARAVAEKRGLWAVAPPP
jgi:endonuclease YncB( thermonuclease family)